MKHDFIQYIQDTFSFDIEELREFEASLSVPLKKTLRINTNKISISDFQEQVQKDGWILSPTSLGKNMFYIDREDTSTALGHTLFHINGYFYVQELAASSSPFYMSGDTRDTGEYTILDMSASPGGKTTQLAEYYPHATIVANEIDKGRLKQLFENLDRLGANNVFVTNYDGRFFKNTPEIFDKILLDAPCSGEGTAYKTDDALKFWNIKNIKRIAKLQFGLIESALIALKIGGELTYSTCTLNRLENEEILEKIEAKYGEHVEIIPLQGESPYIRNWPHKDNTGGFFVAKLQKKSSIPLKKPIKHDIPRQGFEKLSSTDIKTIETFLGEEFAIKMTGKYYSYRNEVYFTDKNIDTLWENYFLFKTGTKIGTLENGVFEPNFFLGTNFGIFSQNTINVNTSMLNDIFHGKEIPFDLSDGFYQVIHNDIPAGIIKVKNNSGKTLLESRFLRK